MSYVSIKRINGKKYNYLTKSIRLPDGKIKKLYNLMKSGESASSLEPNFIPQEKVAYTKFALSKFHTDNVFKKEELGKIEGMRVDYRYLMQRLSKADVKDMLDRFAVNFTYDSNAIEGNSLTLKDVSIVIYENSTIKGKELREIYETKNCRAVIEAVIKRKFKISHADIIRMHSLLMSNIDSRTGYKKIPNYIIGRQVKTASPENVHDEMEALIDFYKNSAGKISPLQLASHFHGKFERIHPFADGNGRVGRFLINAILINNGYPPIIIRKTRRVAYMSSLEAFDFGNKTKLDRFMIERYKETFRGFFEVYVKYL